ncbi:hypothetical protein LDENG_00118360 [Lucifuga dentata]|nr:hypothetical protein LDENG_00118360 [Lucifuga dentata]
MQHTVQLRQVKFFNRALSPTQRQAEKLAGQSAYTNTVKQRVQTQRLESESGTEGRSDNQGGDEQNSPRQAESVTECQSTNKRWRVLHRGWQRTIWQRVSVRLEFKSMLDWYQLATASEPEMNQANERR